jgi:molybdenum cofactor synthesis domain-containing protein
MTPPPSVLARAAIVAVGSELLETTKVDTNSLFITDRLNGVGIDVVSKHVAGDDRAVLTHVLRSALAGADLLVVCGGLGPTDDDLTRDAVADVLERPLAEDPALVEHLQRRYASRGLSVPWPSAVAGSVARRSWRSRNERRLLRGRRSVTASPTTPRSRPGRGAPATSAG